MRPLIAVIVIAVAPVAQAIPLGGVDVPQDKFIVYLAIGHSNMCGRVDDIDRETYDTHPRAWNYKFDDGTNAWIPAQPPVHRDVSWQRGGGPMTPFLKQMVADYPGHYFGVIQNAHSSVTIVDDYRRGMALYDEIVAVAQARSGEVTFGGVVAMLGFMESGNAAQAADFANQLNGMMAELRADLGEPSLPLFIHQLSRGRSNWQTVRDQITAVVTADPYADTVPSDGPYKPGDDVHFTWVGQRLWGQAAAGLVTANGWFPGTAGDTFGPRIARAAAVDGNTVELVFGEPVTATAEVTANYSMLPATAVNAALLDVDAITTTLTTAALVSGTTYSLTVSGVEDVAGNPSNVVASFDYELVDIPRTDLALWLRADDGVIQDTVGSVPLWQDQSGNLRDPIMARFANHPYWLGSAANGLPVVAFWEVADTEGDSLTHVRSASYVGDSTLFLVFRVTATGQVNNSSVFATDANGGASESFQIEVDGGSPGTLQLYSDTAHPIGPVTTALQMVTLRIAGTNLEIRVNGSAVGTSTLAAGEAKRYDLYGVGRNRSGPPFEHMAAEVAELLVYENALAPADVQQVEQVLGVKYGLLLAPAGFTLTPSGGLVTTEAGGTDTFTVQLDAAPSDDVTVPVASGDATEGSVALTQLVFTHANWDVPQTVTVTGLDDAQVDGNVTFDVQLGPATSADGAYDGLDPADVSVTNLDDDGGSNLAPQAVIAGPTQASVGIAVSFYGGGSTDDGTIVSWDWDFGDGSSDSGDLVSHAWSSAGVTTVTLTVTDDGGLTDTDTLDVDVSTAPQPSVTLLRPTGGEVWTAGATESILWTTVDLDDVRIDVSYDNGTSWDLVGYSDIDDPSWGNFDWPVPDVDSSECIILVQGYNFEVPTQSGAFTIRPPASSSPPPVRIEGGCACSTSGPGPVAWLLMITWVLRFARRSPSKSRPRR